MQASTLDKQQWGQTPYGTGNLDHFWVCDALHRVTYLHASPSNKTPRYGHNVCMEKSAVFTPVANYIYSAENPYLYTLQDSTGWKWHFE